MNAETAAAAAYAPNPDRSPFYGDYLFEVVDGNLVHNQEALDNRLALSVYHQIETHEENLRSLRGILIDYGEYEMDSLVLGNSSLVQMLSRKAIPFEFEVYKDGDHGNLIADRLLSNGLIFFAETLEFPN